MSDRRTVIQQRPIVAPIMELAKQLRAAEPTLAALYSDQEVACAIAESIEFDRTNLSAGIAKALSSPTSAPHARNITKSVLNPEVRKSAATASDLSPRGFETAIRKAREDRAARPNEPEMTRTPK